VISLFAIINIIIDKSLLNKTKNIYKLSFINFEIKIKVRVIKNEKKKTIFKIIGILVLTFIFFELLVRFFFPISSPMWEGNEVLGYTHIPNRTLDFVFYEDRPTKLKINSEGFRDIEHKIENQENKYRIIFLGDSMVSSMEVDFEEMFPMIIKKKLENNYPGKFEVFNLGIPGFGTGQEYLVYENYAKKYKPNLILLFFLVNDLSETCGKSGYKPFYFINENNTLVADEFKPRIHSKFEYLLSNSKLLLYLRTKYYEIMYHKALKKDVERGKTRDFYKPFLIDYPPEIDNCWEVIFEFYRRIKKDTNLNNILLKVITVPEDFDLYEDVRRDKFFGTGTLLNESYFDLDKPYKILAEFLRSENISYFNLLPELKKIDKNLYYPIDAHMIREGHEITADILYEYLKKEKIINYKPSI